MHGRGGIAGVVKPHGHARSDLRNLRLHRAAIEKLRRHPELREPCLDLVREWRQRKENQASAPWLAQWHEMLSCWSVDRIADAILGPEEGQTLRQCSPLAPVLTPRERWAVLEAVEQEASGDVGGKSA